MGPVSFLHGLFPSTYVSLGIHAAKLKRAVFTWALEPLHRQIVRSIEMKTWQGFDTWLQAAITLLRSLLLHHEASNDIYVKCLIHYPSTSHVDAKHRFSECNSRFASKKMTENEGVTWCSTAAGVLANWKEQMSGHATERSSGKLRKRGKEKNEFENGIAQNDSQYQIPKAKYRKSRRQKTKYLYFTYIPAPNLSQPHWTKQTLPNMAYM